MVKIINIPATSQETALLNLECYSVKIVNNYMFSLNDNCMLDSVKHFSCIFRYSVSNFSPVLYVLLNKLKSQEYSLFSNFTTEV